MFCTNCGKEIPDQSKFCTNCGVSISTSVANPSMAVPTPINQAPIKRKRFEVSKIFIIFLYILLGLIILAGIGIGVMGQGGSGALIKVVINWLLGVIFGLSVLGMIGGVIAGVVLLIKANDKEDPSYYKRNALWCFLGPIMLIVGIILAYVIINVVSNLVGPATVITQ